MNGIPIDAKLPELLAVISREREDDRTKITPELFGLELANNSLRQLLPALAE